MVALRTSRSGQIAPVCLAGLFFLLGSTRIGPQDIAALMAQQSAASERWRAQISASPFGTIHAAVFSLPRPLGTLTPEPESVRLARFTPEPQSPQVNRSGKGDLAVPRLQIQIMAELLREDAVAAGEEAPDDAEELQVALRFGPFIEHDFAMSFESDPQISREMALNPAALPDDPDAPEPSDAGRPFGTARVYFDAAPIGIVAEAVKPWSEGDAPIVMLPAQPETAVARAPAESIPDTKLPEIAKPHVAVAGVKTPAELLGLTAKNRAKAEKCLANAVYFEARSEPVRGQIAVAQVVLNRAFSGYYPDDVCGVVYQNAHRVLSCQFTFACDGIPDVVTEPEHWQRATRIAKATLDGKVWLPDVGKATHYHASYVYPYWVRSMRKLKKIGLHTFYRPRKWGDGADEPSWGSPATIEMAAKL
jgi:spore germination cell wall hydrolase CwlJ-like protein